MDKFPGFTIKFAIKQSAKYVLAYKINHYFVEHTAMQKIYVESLF